MIELVKNQLVFRFPEVHPDCLLTVTLHRTLRIPDDGREYPLPPSLGSFPVVHIDDYACRVPKKWLGRGGVAIPMWQSEAMWLQFTPSQPAHRASAWPFAVKIAAGKVSAITGKKWSKELQINDYLVCPLQPWIDGFVTDEGQIKQFIAAALGMGATVEGQVTGKEEFGGIQIEVLPMSLSEFDKRFPPLPPPPPQPNFLRSRGLNLCSSGLIGSNLGSPGYSTISYTSSNIYNSNLIGYNNASITMSCVKDRQTKGFVNEMSEISETHDAYMVQADASLDMGMGAGGRMKQQIFKDPYGLKVWSKKHKSRIFIHLCNSLGWKHLTGKESPTVPLSASHYTAHGMPWYHYYEENAQSLQGTKTLKKVKSIAEYSAKKKMPLLPENQPAHVSSCQTVIIPQKEIGKVRNGSWAK